MIHLNSYEKGDPHAPTVVCLHGLLGSGRNLYRLVEAIASAGFRAIAYDQRGHGHSEHATDYSLSALSSDVFRLLDQKKIERAHLVGHSMGARVSIAAASLAPERIKSITLLDSGITIRAEHLEALREIIAPLPETYLNRAEAEQALAHHSNMMKQFLLANLRAESESPYKLRWVFDLRGIRDELLQTIKTDQSEAYKDIPCPILVARGEKSDSMRAEDLELMLQLNKNAQGAVIENAGHWVHAENFSRTAEVVTSFLKAVEK